MTPMTPMTNARLALATAAFAAWCLLGTVPAQSHEHQHHGHHRAQQGVIGLDVYRDGGAIHLLSAEQRGEQTVLWHRRSDDAGVTWSAPVRVDGPGRAPRPTRRGDEAQIAARGDTLLAIWSVSGTGYGKAGPLSAGLSRDGGKTWRALTGPSDSGFTKGEGFADLVAGNDAFHAVWLDNRDGAQGLRYSALRNAETWAPNTTISTGTCECCWNTLLMRDGVLRVLFRDKDPRDMALASLEKGAWVKHGSVGNFGWRIKGCPETGGGLAVTADGSLHALVWTGHEGKTGLYAVREGATRGSAPRRMGSPDARHGDLAAEANRVAAVWDDGDAIFAALSADAGKTWSAPQRLSRPGVRATNPRIAVAGDAFLAFWTQLAPEGAWTLELQKVASRPQ